MVEGIHVCGAIPFNFCTLAIIFFFVAWFPPISNKKHNYWTWRAHPPICKCTFASLEIHFQLGKIQFLILTNTSLYLAKVSKGGCTVQLRCELSNLPASHCKSFSSFSEYYQNPNCFFRIWILQSKKKPIQPSTIWMLKGNSEKQICTVCAMLGVLRANKNLRRSHWQSSPAPAEQTRNQFCWRRRRRPAPPPPPPPAGGRTNAASGEQRLERPGAWCLPAQLLHSSHWTDLKLNS